MKYLFLIFVFCAAVCTTIAQSKDQKPDKPERPFVILPVIFYSPETSFGFGGFGMYYFRLDTLPEAKPSTVQGVLIYTLEKQIISQLPLTLFLKKDEYWLRINPFYSVYPFQFYGVGNNINLKKYDSYDAISTGFEFYGLKRVNEGLYIGPRFQHVKYHSMKTTTDLGLLTENTQGYGRGGLNGIGGGIVFDRRNNMFAPDQGFYFEYKAMNYGSYINSAYNFSDMTLDVRKYFSVGEKGEWASNFFHQSQFGAVPFYALAQLGGDSRLRGYYQGAYRNKHYTVMQTEFRYALTKRIILASFGGIGGVSSDFGTYGKSLVAGGVGVRFEIDPKEKLRLRIDYALGEQTSGVYFNINEAF